MTGPSVHLQTIQRESQRTVTMITVTEKAGRFFLRLLRGDLPIVG